MVISHSIASGMGGIRTAGDLVARMQMTRNMRIDEAKKFVAKKLGIDVSELTDPLIMGEIREEYNLGRIQPGAGEANGIEAKINIAELLGIEINSVKKFKEKANIK